MPFFYDVVRAHTTSATAATETTLLWGQTAANQQVAAIAAVFVSARLATAGGGTIRVKTNSGTAASGGSSYTPGARNILFPAAQSAWKHDGGVITPGVTLSSRISVGFAQAGGMGGWVAQEPSARIAMQPNAASPVDVEVSSISTAASVPTDVTVELAEGP